FREVIEELQPVRLAQIERDGLLVAIAGKVVRAEFADKRRAPAARVVAGAGPFDLDDLGAEIAEQLAAERTSQDARDIENAKVGKRGRHAVIVASGATQMRYWLTLTFFADTPWQSVLRARAQAPSRLGEPPRTGREPNGRDGR